MTQLKNTYRKKQMQYKKFLRKPTENNRTNYCKIRNMYDRMTKAKKQNYIKLMLE